MGDARLPRSGKEGFAYGSIICALTVLVMLVLNLGMTFGSLDASTWASIGKAYIPVWIVAMLLETFVVGRFANFMVGKFSEPSDGFNAKILFNILFVVLGMSGIMTFLGPVLFMNPVKGAIMEWPLHWPRNFCVAMWCELLFAQPIARQVMKRWHNYQDSKLTAQED
ncbi:MAG: DUF2798 domain-containing protein [Eubacterium sp.]|nr:DUF2798 domain-containing protein [Eubacterium sp.]